MAAIGDVNGDGFLDVVMANLGNVVRDAGDLEVREPNRLFKGNGLGGLSDVTDSAGLSGTLQPSWDVELADFDNDGDLDILFANAKYAMNYDPEKHTTDFRDRLLWNDGKGHFTEDLSTGLSAQSEQTFGFTIADLSGDGHLDVIIRQKKDTRPYLDAVDSSHNNRLYFGDGSGGFTEVTNTSLTSQIDKYTVCADVDNDGDVDCVMSNGVGDHLGLFLNDGSGSFGNGTVILAQEMWMAMGARLPPPTPNPALSPRLRRVPSPHHPSSALPCRSDVDLFGVVSAAEWPHRGFLRVFINEPLGTFTLADETFLSIALQSSYEKTVDGVFTIALGDLDADGDVDFVLGETEHDHGKAKRTFLNNGRGIFTEVDLGYRTKAGFTTALAVVDLDGDGDLEVLEANSPINSMYGESRILCPLAPLAPSCCTYLLHRTARGDRRSGCPSTDDVRRVPRAQHGALHSLRKWLPADLPLVCAPWGGQP
eukprot:scaffold130400_cov63-Phaeocystis_antarctica.AAC.6